MKGPVTPEEHRAESIARRIAKANKRARDRELKARGIERDIRPERELVLTENRLPPPATNVGYAHKLGQHAVRKRGLKTGHEVRLKVLAYDTAHDRLRVRVEGARRDTFISPRALRRGWLPVGNPA